MRTKGQIPVCIYQCVCVPVRLCIQYMCMSVARVCACVLVCKMECSVGVWAEGE